MTAVVLVVRFVVILGVVFIFTAAVEILSEQLNLGRGTVGSVLAAVSTAVPETMILPLSLSLPKSTTRFMLTGEE